MNRRTLLGGFATTALAGIPTLSWAEVSVNIGINLPAPPRLVVIPSSPVVYAPSVEANYFSFGGQFYVFTNGYWYAGPRYNGPWTVVAPEFVPRPILSVPVRYYRVPPPAWGHSRREAPPQWEPHWGRRWDERREVRHEEQQEERREDRREDRREERREDRRDNRRERQGDRGR